MLSLASQSTEWIKLLLWWILQHDLSSNSGVRSNSGWSFGSNRDLYSRGLWPNIHLKLLDMRLTYPPALWHKVPSSSCHGFMSTNHRQQDKLPESGYYTKLCLNMFLTWFDSNIISLFESIFLPKRTLLISFKLLNKNLLNTSQNFVYNQFSDSG